MPTLRRPDATRSLPLAGRGRHLLIRTAQRGPTRILPYPLSRRNLDALRRAVGEEPITRELADRDVHRFAVDELRRIVKEAQSRNPGWAIRLAYDHQERCYDLRRGRWIGCDPVWFHAGPLAENDAGLPDDIRGVLSAFLALMRRDMGLYTCIESAPWDWGIEMLTEDLEHELGEARDKALDTKAADGTGQAETRRTTEDSDEIDEIAETLQLAKDYANYYTPDSWIAAAVNQACDRSLIQSPGDPRDAVLGLLDGVAPENARRHAEVLGLVREGLAFHRADEDIFVALHSDIDLSDYGGSLEAWYGDLYEGGATLLEPEGMIGLTYRDDAVERHMRSHIDSMTSCGDTVTVDFLIEASITNDKQSLSADGHDAFLEWLLRFHAAYEATVNS